MGTPYSTLIDELLQFWCDQISMYLPSVLWIGPSSGQVKVMCDCFPVLRLLAFFPSSTTVTFLVPQRIFSRLTFLSRSPPLQIKKMFVGKANILKRICF